MKRVLILTQPSDVHAPPVAEEMRRRGSEVLCFDLADFPGHVSLQATLTDSPGWNGTLTAQGQTIALDTLTGIWWRRPQRFQVPQAYEPAERQFLERESYRGFLGIMESLEILPHHALWVSRPQSIRRAELKPLQLALAQQLGLRTPRTLLTNEPAAVQDFYDQCGGKVILKAVAKGIIEEPKPRFFYTSQVKPEHLSHLEGVRVTTHLFQEMIPKALELRVVVIGKQVFAVEISSQQSEHTQLDWRRYYPDLTYHLHALPDALRAKLLALVHRCDIQFASMDLILTPQGDYIWIELNPNGQYYWLQMQLGDQLPLKEAMADLLVFPEEYRL